MSFIKFCAKHNLVKLIFKSRVVKMLNRYLQIFLACLIAVSASASERVGSVEDSVLRGLRGGMRAIDLPLRVARERAEDLYGYYHGDELGTGQAAGVAPAYFDQLKEGAINSYIQKLSICSKYWVRFQWESDRPTKIADGGVAEIAGATVPLPETMFDKEIYLIPVHDENDYRITTWECATNFTLDHSIFKGDSKRGAEMNDTTAVALRSIITKYTDDPIMEKCVFAQGAIWTAIVSGAGSCEAEAPQV